MSNIILYNFMRVRCNIKLLRDVSIENDLKLEIFHSTENKYEDIAAIKLK